MIFLSKKYTHCHFVDNKTFIMLYIEVLALYFYNNGVATVECTGFWTPRPSIKKSREANSSCHHRLLNFVATLKHAAVP